ncbi:MAG: dienelactone hydrolase family protein [Candidatus Sumerlaeia bacterium]|nr:dienelactone hydrolase family protein [Candidatus Sumerlaeia bacterium]
MLLRITLALLMILPLPLAAQEITTSTFMYEDAEERQYQGFATFPDDAEGPVPGVIIVHQWTGPSDHEMRVARRLAALGYAALVVDVYGVGIRPEAGQEAATISSKYREDRALLRERVGLGLDWMKEQENIDATRLAVIGYCFGGMAALEMARGGAEVTGVVSLHGNLNTGENPEDDPITAKVLVLHGAADPLVPISQVEAFHNEMHARDADWQLIAYGGAKHSFTEPAADLMDNDAVGYDPDADRRSWQAMLAFFEEIFGE